MNRKLRAALTLTAGDWYALVASWWLLLAVDLGLRLLPFSRLLNLIGWLTPGPRTPGRPQDAPLLSRRCAAMVGVAARYHLLPMNCLRRALALRWLLAVRGIPADLRIGVDKGRHGLSAHAWVEREGTPLGEEADVGLQFAPLAPMRS